MLEFTVAIWTAYGWQQHPEPGFIWDDFWSARNYANELQHHLHKLGLVNRVVCVLMRRRGTYHWIDYPGE